ncbi:MAG: hypothetical protein LBC68_12310 [Prevotellaceae bacterium]|jgi:hypothetical protein|nr:hypothetical protein [Prevotellaceae bacterium]
MKKSYSNFRAVFFKLALVIQIFGLFFLMSCATTKKTVVTADTNTVSAETTDNTKISSISNFVDTTKIADAEISYTRIEFYLPAADTTLPDSIRLPVKSIETLNIKYSTENKGVTSVEEKSAEKIQENAVFLNSQKVEEIAEQKAKHWLKYVMWIVVCMTIISAVIYAYKFFKKIKI